MDKSQPQTQAGRLYVDAILAFEADARADLVASQDLVLASWRKENSQLRTMLADAEREIERLRIENEMLRDLLTPTDADVDEILALPLEQTDPEPPPRSGETTTSSCSQTRPRDE